MDLRHADARGYLELGLHPIACAPRSKRPCVEWRPFQEIQPTREQLDQWWAMWPDANVALVLGRGMFAVDLDGGIEALRLLKDRGILLPANAPTSRTANGLHVFLSAPGHVPDRVGLLTTNGGKPQVDIRGVGIVVAPRSIHPTGVMYDWQVPLTLPLPPAPQALLDLIHTGRVREPVGGVGSTWVIDALKGVPEGQRDDMCARLAGYFLNAGLDAATVEALLCESFARNCQPPFDSASVRKCVRSIARKESHRDNGTRAIAPEHISAVLQEWHRQVDSGPPEVFPTPFPTLNKYLGGGFGPGELIYLGARPGVGKTALSLEIARHVAREGRSALVVSREMVSTSLVRRTIAQAARIPAAVLKTGALDQAQWHVYGSVYQDLAALPLWLTDQAVSIGEIIGLVEHFKADAPLALLVVDYLQLVRAPADIRERRLQVEAVSQALKTLAVQHRIAVLCLSSLSRPSSEARDRRPTLADLRESGALEHDADLVLLLHRKHMEPETECIVAKNRDGRQGTAHLRFRYEYVAFEEAKKPEGNE